jgi:nicotinamidase/pyrazinamidase
MKALVVVDMQVDFGDPSGSLYVAGGEALVDPVNDLVRRFRAAGDLVVYTQDSHPPQTPHFDTWPVHCVAGTPGSALLPGLLVEGQVVQKGTDGRDGYSGFSVRDPLSGASSPTVLEALLRAAGVDEVVVVGLAGDYCVGETALDAARLGFTVSMPLELTRFVALDPADEPAMIARVRDAGVAA